MNKDEKREKKQEIELDMETTIADMNVEGFSWYNPAKKADEKSGKQEKIYLTKKEKRAIRKAAWQAMIPIFFIIAIAFALVYFLARIWLS